MMFSPSSSSSTANLKTVLGICVIVLLVLPSSDGDGDGDGDETKRSGVSPLSKLRIKSSSNYGGLEIKRHDFPSDFLFGAGSSAAQIEGSTRKGGRGPSIWDYFVRVISGKIVDHSDMDTSIDSYKRYKEDVKALKELGVDSYRFSISWTRILPNGSLSGGVNQEGIDYYNNVINELIKNGIKPFVTIFHFDSPQALQDKYGGFLSDSIVNDFKDYCEICFKSFGDRVEHWITMNEPLVIAQLGYDLGLAAPGRCSKLIGDCLAGNSSTEPYIVSHNLLLAHAAAAGLYKKKFQGVQGGEIGISLEGLYFEPYSQAPEDFRAARRALDFHLGWYMEPLVHGNYPASMRYLVKKRLPTFTKEEREMVKGSFDFIGINYYTSRYAKGVRVDHHASPPSFTRDTSVELKVSRIDGKTIGEKVEGPPVIYVYPQGLQKLLVFMKEKYNSPKIYITENGVPEARNDSRKLDEALKDDNRINFILRHLYRVHKAMKKGVNVKGYFHWSLCDSFEWGTGYTLRYGFYYVDYKNNLKRIPKQSVSWLHDFLHGHHSTSHPM